MESMLVQNIKNGYIMGLHKSYEWVEENVLQHECVSQFKSMIKMSDKLSEADQLLYNKFKAIDWFPRNKNVFIK